MIYKSENMKVNKERLVIFPFLLILFIFLFSCQESDTSDETVNYQPQVYSDDWQISTPQQQGLNPEDFEYIYKKANNISHLYSLLVVKNGFLIAEKYFNEVQLNDSFPIASVTKCYLSALMGIAIREGIIPDVHQKMVNYFPEFSWENLDPRKSQITIQQMLQMRSGYPWEEMDGYYDELWPQFDNWLPLIVEFPLTSDPGTRFGYSNLTSHILGIIIARAYGYDLLSFAQAYLCEPLGVNLTKWWKDSLGYYYGHGDMHFTPRDMAKFGLLYLNNGIYNEQQIVPVEWIEESLTPYSFNIYGREILTYIHQLNYGYKWLSGTVGNHDIKFAWGHGGQLIVILYDLRMVIVTTADYLPGQYGQAAWNKEKSVLDLVGEFISRL